MKHYPTAHVSNHEQSLIVARGDDGAGKQRVVHAFMVGDHGLTTENAGKFGKIKWINNGQLMLANIHETR